MDRTKRTFWLWAGAGLCAGLLLRLWFVVHLPLIDGDSLIYGGIARNWLQRGVYGFSPGHAPGSIDPTLIRLPGYPLFLAACFFLFGMEHYHAVMFVQVGADLATCWLASALAGRLFGRRAALVVLWLAALCPFTASYTAVPLTETLVLTTIALAFYGFLRWQEAGQGISRWLGVIAAAAAGSLLLRPEQGLLAAAVVPAMAWRSLSSPKGRRDPWRSGVPAAVAALLIVLPLVPWTVRNWNTFHVVQPLVPKYATDPGEVSPAGFGRWYRTWGIEFASTEDFYWNYDGNRMDFAGLPPRAYDDGSPANSGANSLRSRTASLFEDYNVRTHATRPIDSRFAALAEERVHAHPVLYYVGLPVARLLNMTLRPRTEMMDVPLDWWRWQEYGAKTAFAAAYAALNLAYLGIGLAGFLRWRRQRWLSASDQQPFRELAFAMAATIILRCALLLTLDNSEPRYTLEFFPVLFVWAGALFASPAPAASAGEAAGR